MVENSAWPMSCSSTRVVMRTSPAGKFRAERMMGLVEPAAVEIIAEPLDPRTAERQLRRLAERAVQAAIVGRLLIADRVHDRDQLAPQCRRTARAPMSVVMPMS